MKQAGIRPKRGYIVERVLRLLACTSIRMVQALLFFVILDTLA
jgi:hypothetical protein